MTRLCAVEGCEGSGFHRSPYCEKHYRRNLKYGSPLGGRKTFAGEGQKWLRDHKDWVGDDCLTWPFATSEKRGYGFTKYGKRDMHAHRAMCILAHGEPENEALFALHSCGNGHLGCVNPRHLRWGTPLENTHDRYAHGTMTEGEDHHQAKLTAEDVKRIVEIGRSMTGRAIGEMFGVTESTVSLIRRGKIWRSVIGNPTTATSGAD